NTVRTFKAGENSPVVICAKIYISTIVPSKARLAMVQRHGQPEETTTMPPMSSRQPWRSAIGQLLIGGLFDCDVVFDVSHTLDIPGEVAGPVFLVPRIDKAGQLDH